LVEVHGSIATSSCSHCGACHGLEAVQARLRADADAVPRCECGEALKPDVVLFGELLPAAALDRAQALAEQADLMLCIGSSLEVYPVAQLPTLTLARGGSIVLVTQGKTPLDGAAEIKLDGDVEAVLQALVRELEFDVRLSH